MHQTMGNIYHAVMLHPGIPQ